MGIPLINIETKRYLESTISFRQQLTYALPVIVTALLLGPLAIVQGIYAKYFGLSLITIAKVLLVARIFDAVTDPLIGYYSDLYHQHTGSRKPFVICGSVLLIFSAYFLYAPLDWKTLEALDQGTTTSITVSAGYFFGWFLLFYFSWTLIEIPHLAWASELAVSSNEKSRIYSLRYSFATIGNLTFYAIPMLSVFSSNEITPITLYWLVILASCLMLPCVYFCIKLTPCSAMPPSSTKSQRSSSSWANIQSLSKETMANKPLILFLMAVSATTIGVSGMWFTLIFIYADSYLQLGEHFALASLISPCLGLLFIGGWYVLAVRLGKQVTLSVAMLCSTTGIVLTGFLSPGESGFISLLLVMILCYGLGASANGALAPSLLADIIDYHRWKFGGDHTGTYFSLYTFVAKGSLAIGGAMGLAVAGVYGFDPAEEIHSVENIMGLHLAIAWIPAVMVLVSIVLFLSNPMTTRRHNIIRKRLLMQAGKSS